MIVAGSIVELVLWLYLMLLLVRIVVDWTQMFARSWHPSGPVLVGLEVVYTATDPPIRLFRRMVPPLRLGAIVLDLSVLFVLLLCFILRLVNQRVLLDL